MPAQFQPVKPDILLVNAALRNLVEFDLEEWEKDAQIVISYACDLPEAPDSFKEALALKSSGSSAEALTTLGTTAKVEDTSQDTSYSHIERTPGFEKTRVGHFKLWRSGTTISFQSFWKVDLGTQPDITAVATHYRITFEPDTFLPHAFGVVRPEIRFDFSFWRRGFSYYTLRYYGLKGCGAEGTFNAGRLTIWKKK